MYKRQGLYTKVNRSQQEYFLQWTYKLTVPFKHHIISSVSYTHLDVYKRQDQDHWDNEDEIITYLKKVLNKEAFDHAGLIDVYKRQHFSKITVTFAD